MEGSNGFCSSSESNLKASYIKTRNEGDRNSATIQKLSRRTNSVPGTTFASEGIRRSLSVPELALDVMTLTRQTRGPTSFYLFLAFQCRPGSPPLFGPTPENLELRGSQQPRRRSSHDSSSDKQPTPAAGCRKRPATHYPNISGACVAVRC